MGLELPQHDSAVADRQRCVVFVDGADDHSVRTDCLGDPDGIALRTQVVHQLVAVLLGVCAKGGRTQRREKVNTVSKEVVTKAGAKLC